MEESSQIIADHPPKKEKNEHDDHEGGLINVVALVHGIDSPFGTKNDMKYLEQEIAKTNFFQLIIVSSVNTGKTTDGIDVGGRRLAEEIETELQKYDKNPETKFLFSIVGHSLGGLYSRSCIKFLHERTDIWNRIIPVSYSSLSSPHLGVRRPSSGFFNYALDLSARVWYRGRTLKQLLLEDGTIGSDQQPFLYEMSEPESEYMKVLSLFQHRTLFAIIKGDFQVPYCSSAITSHNPYKRDGKAHGYRIIGHAGFVINEILKEILEEAEENDYDPIQIVKHLVMSESVTRQKEEESKESEVDHEDIVIQPTKEEVTEEKMEEHEDESKKEKKNRKIKKEKDEENSSKRHKHHHKERKHEEKDSTKKEEWVIDHYRELEYSPKIIHHLRSLKWRRIDLEFSGMFAHDFLIRKATIPFLVNAHTPGEFVVKKVINLLLHDHRMARNGYNT